MEFKKTRSKQQTINALKDHVGWLAKNFDRHGDEAEDQAWSLILSVGEDWVWVCPYLENMETGGKAFGDPVPVDIDDVNAWTYIMFAEANEKIENLPEDPYKVNGFVAAKLVLSALEAESLAEEVLFDEALSMWIDLCIDEASALEKAAFLITLADQCERLDEFDDCGCCCDTDEDGKVTVYRFVIEG